MKSTTIEHCGHIRAVPVLKRGRVLGNNLSPSLTITDKHFSEKFFEKNECFFIMFKNQHNEITLPHPHTEYYEYIHGIVSFIAWGIWQ